MKTYKVNDVHGGNEEEIQAASAYDAAKEYMETGDYEASDDGTYWVKFRVQEIDDDGEDVGNEETVKIAVEPDEPDCVSWRDEHDWQSPISLVGGCKENPGVFGHGGGVRIHKVCIYCGTEEITDTWAQDPCDGEQGLDSTEYKKGKYAAAVKPEYKYEVLESINDGQALISVDAYQFGELIAGAMFVVDADGDTEQDTASDGCKSNPFDKDGCWPEPPQHLINEAVELIAA